MTFDQMLSAHFTVDRWGILQFLLNGMVDPRQGIIAPFELMNQGYGDDMLQLRFLSEVLENNGINVSEQQIVRCPVMMTWNGEKPRPAPMPGLSWNDSEGTHVFTPCPFYRFGKNVPVLQFEPDTERTATKFVSEIEKMCQWRTLKSGGVTTDACIYSPAFYPNTLHWDSETETMMLAVLGTHQKPGIGSFYFELSRYSWEDNGLIVKRRAGVKADISFAHLYEVQLALGGIEPMAGLKYLVSNKWTEAIPDAGINVQPGNEEMLANHASLFVKLIQAVMAFPDQQQKALFNKINDANRKLEAHRPS